LIRHIVFFSARADEDVAAIKAGLELLGQIPHSNIFEVALNAKVDPLCEAIDVVVYAEFSDLAALAAYKAHPKYAEVTRNVKPLRELRYSADIESEGRN
jgi:Stress responsive A/B Barrel Domain